MTREGWPTISIEMLIWRRPAKREHRLSMKPDLEGRPRTTDIP